MRFLNGIGCLLLAVACASQSTHVGSDPDSRAVQRTVNEIIAADNARDVNRVLACYAPDAVLIPPGEEPLTGIDSIRPRYEMLFAHYDPAITTELTEVTVNGDVACVRGRNGGKLRGRDGAPDRSIDDAYVMLLRRGTNDRWQISHLKWQSVITHRIR